MLEKIKENKKMMVMVGIVVVVLVIILVLVNVFKKDDIFTVKNEDGIKFADEYEKLNSQTMEDGKEYPKVQIPSDNIIEYSTVSDILNIFNTNGDGVVYFGYSTCLYCRNAIQVLIDTAKESELDVIHYIDISEVWDEYELDENNKVIKTKEENEKYYELLDALGDELIMDYMLESTDGKEISVGVKRIEVPLVIFITNGMVSSYNKGTLFSQEDPLVEMDASQIQGLSEIYGYGIGDVVSAKKNKGIIK